MANGKKGRCAIPTEILEARGSTEVYNHRGEIKPEKGPMEPPSWLTATAKRAWFDLFPKCTWLTLADRNLFARYCQTWAPYTENESMKKTRDHKIAKELSELLLRMEGQLGLTPAARPSIKLDTARPRTTDAKLKLFHRNQ